jgi:hypothetical protein
MTLSASPIHLTVCLTEAQLGYLFYLYPDEDPEEALVKLLEGDRLRALSSAERDVRVLYFAGDGEGDHTVSDYLELIVNFLISKKFLSCLITLLLY